MEIPEPDLSLLRRWGMLEDMEVILGGWCSRVYASGEKVLKVPFVGEEMISGWRAALTLSGGVGVEVYDHDSATGSLLMKRLRPGTPLGESGASFADMREVFIDFFQAMQDVSPIGCMPMVDYFETPWKVPLAVELEDSAPIKRFLHADLHHHNILKDKGRWVVIDPKGVYGDPHYEPIAWLRNPIDRLREVANLTSHVATEIEALCNRLSLDPARVIKWGILDSDGHENPIHPWARLPSVYQELAKQL